MSHANIRTLRRAVKVIFPLSILTLWIVTATPLLADTTLRYQSEIKASPSLPPQAQEQMKKSALANGSTSTTRMKNGKAFSNAGGWTQIIDFAKEQITLLDVEQKTFVTLPAAQFPDKLAAQMPKMPEEAKKMMAAMKTSVESRITGRTDTIQGIRAEEREVVFTIELPLPGGTHQSGMSMKMLMGIWTAKPEEALRNQAIRELMGVNLWSSTFMNPTATMQKLMSNMPGVADALKSMTGEFSKNRAVMLRMHMAMFMSMPGMPGDPNSPTLEMTQEAVEVSSAAVDDAVFQIPADYREVPADELFKSIMDRKKAEITAK